MKQIRLLIFAVLLTAIMSSNLLAGDYADFNFIGFSKDGKYLAFEDYGLTDSIENSQAYSSIYLINTAKNNLVVAPFKSLGKNENRETELDAVRDKNRRLADKQLKKFGIVAGNTGMQVVAYLINQFPLVKGQLEAPSGKELFPREASFTKSRNSHYRDGFYSLDLEIVPGSQKKCSGFTLAFDEFKFDNSKVLRSAGKSPKDWIGFSIPNGELVKQIDLIITVFYGLLLVGSPISAIGAAASGLLYLFRLKR